jgi:hypothetical protein
MAGVVENGLFGVRHFFMKRRWGAGPASGRKSDAGIETAIWTGLVPLAALNHRGEEMLEGASVFFFNLQVEKEYGIQRLRLKGIAQTKTPPNFYPPGFCVCSKKKAPQQRDLF